MWGGKGSERGTHTHNLPFGQCQCQRATAVAATTSAANAFLMEAAASTRKPFKHLGRYATVVVVFNTLATHTRKQAVCV